MMSSKEKEIKKLSDRHNRKMKSLEEKLTKATNQIDEFKSKVSEFEV